MSCPLASNLAFCPPTSLLPGRLDKRGDAHIRGQTYIFVPLYTTLYSAYSSHYIDEASVFIALYSEHNAQEHDVQFANSKVINALVFARILQTIVADYRCRLSLQTIVADYRCRLSLQTIVAADYRCRLSLQTIDCRLLSLQSVVADYRCRLLFFISPWYLFCQTITGKNM